MKERWKPVVGYEGLYEVSDLGRVRSLPKRVAHWAGGTRLCEGRVMRLQHDDDGYAKLGLWRDGVLKTARVCRLVLLSFRGNPPSSEYECAHADGSKHNDSLKNLSWKTCKGNAADREKHGTTARGQNIGKATQNPGSVERLRDLVRFGCRQIDVGRWLGLSQSQVSAIARRQFWKHV